MTDGGHAASEAVDFSVDGNLRRNADVPGLRDEELGYRAIL